MIDGAANGSYVIPLAGGSIFALQPTVPLTACSHTVQFFDSHTHHLSAALAIDIVTAAPVSSADFSVDPSELDYDSDVARLRRYQASPARRRPCSSTGAIQATATVAGDGTYRFVVDPVAPGSHEAFVTLTDLAGNVSTPSAPVDIAVVAPFAVDAGPDQTVNEGATVQLAATESGGAAVTETWTLVSATNGQTIDPVVGPDLTFVPQSAGVYVFQHTATDAAGDVGTDTVTVTALDVPPTLGLTGLATAVAGTEYDLSLSATDPGNEVVNGWHVVWGDGSTSDLAGIATQAPA